MKVGVLGGGQLGRMLALAGYPLGLRFRFLDPSPDAPAAHLAEHIAGDYTDTGALARFADGLDVVTYEFENVPVEAVRYLSETLKVPVYPPLDALSVSQDRLLEKSFFNTLGIPTAPFAAVASFGDLGQAVEQLGLPAVLKTRRFGYDGKGQYLLRRVEDIPAAWPELGKQPLILEGFVGFTRELSVLGVRGKGGEMRFYPLVENRHSQGILRLSLAPAPEVSSNLQEMAERYAGLVMERLGYVGVLAIELFQVGEGLVANEMAPRVHNSGHWTIEGAETSQFENHLRAVLGLPLGSTEARGPSAMANIIGTLPDVSGVLAVPGAHLHLYGKAPRAGRKLGHITLTADGSGALEPCLSWLLAALE